MLISVSGKPTWSIFRDMIKDVLQIPDEPKTQYPYNTQTDYLKYPYPQGSPLSHYNYNTPGNYQSQTNPSPYGQRNERQEMYLPSGPAGIYNNNDYQFQANPSPYGQRNERLEMYPPPIAPPTAISNNNLYIQDPPFQIDVRNQNTY